MHAGSCSSSPSPAASPARTRERPQRRAGSGKRSSCGRPQRFLATGERPRHSAGSERCYPALGRGVNPQSPACCREHYSQPVSVCPYPPNLPQVADRSQLRDLVSEAPAGPPGSRLRRPRSPPPATSAGRCWSPSA